MSNLFLTRRFSERVHRLALGIEPIDAARGARVRQPIQILIEPQLPESPRPRLIRHGSGLFVLVYQSGLTTTLDVRLCDLGEQTDAPGYRTQTNRRRLIPRRLRITIPAAEEADALPVTRRVRRPALLPGAAYEITDSMTGMRGRVIRGGVPVRWARVAARRPGAPPADPPVGRAHCDDRGEFLLLLAPAAAPMTTLEHPFELDLVVHAPIAPASPRPRRVHGEDELWDLPLEPLSESGDPDDPVAEGGFPPVGWGPGVGPVRTEFVYGRLQTGGPPLNL